MRPHPHRMPPVEAKYVVTISAVARMLDWTTAKVRSIDDVLKPTRVASGERLYDVARVLFFVKVQDNAPPVSEPIVVTWAEHKELLAQYRAEREAQHAHWRELRAARRRGARRPGSLAIRRS